MDTKLKSRRKLGIFLIIVTILSAAYVMLYNYDVIYEKAVEEAQKTYTTSLSGDIIQDRRSQDVTG